MSHKNQSAVLLKAIISGTVRFLPMAIPCTLTYPSKHCGTGKVKLYQFRSFDFDSAVQGVRNHLIETIAVFGVRTGDRYFYGANRNDAFRCRTAS